MKFFLSLLALVCAMCLAQTSVAQQTSTDVKMRPDVRFTLRTDIAEGQLVYISESGPTKGQVNPDLRVPENAVVQISVINGDGAIHDIAVPEFGAQSEQVIGKGAATAIVFRAGKSGTFEYLCTLPGHKAAGMFGKLIVGEPQEQAESDALDIVQDPTAVGKPIAKRGAEHVTFDLVTTKALGKLATAT